jgi:uncharacterized membrane-anchored protein
MPTQEERLDTVEYDLRQFKTETVRAYQDMALEMTVIKGLTEDSIRRLSTLSGTMEKRFDGVDRRFEGIDTRLDTMDTRLGTMDTRLDRVEDMLAQILERLPEKP